MNINELTSQDIGVNVIYVPDGKQGKITSFNGRFVFVAFAHTAGRGEAVRPEDLLRVSTDGNKGLEEVRCEVCGKVIMVNGSWTDETAGVCSGFCERELCGECGDWDVNGECPQCRNSPCGSCLTHNTEEVCNRCGHLDERNTWPDKVKTNNQPGTPGEGEKYGA